MSTSAPVTWHGGKARLARKIVALFPPHQSYVEPFGGGASVLIAKQPSEIEVYNDLDQGLTNLFRVLRNPTLFRKLVWALENTPYSRSEFQLSQSPAIDPVEAARRLVVRQRQSYGGRGERWSFCIKDAHAGTASAVRRWHRGIEQLPFVHDRFRSVQIECADWRVVMDRYDTPKSVFFLDPPYHPLTRVGGEYQHEFSCNDHHGLIERVLTGRGMFVLSGYEHESYTRLERYGWKRVDYDVPAYSSDTRTRRVECLWLSPTIVNYEARPMSPLSRTEKMREGAYHVHKLRVGTTTRKVLGAIEKFRAAGKKPTIVALAQATKLSREHLGRRYRHLFV
jgi:DNA adenine methylase